MECDKWDEHTKLLPAIFDYYELFVGFYNVAKDERTAL